MIINLIKNLFNNKTTGAFVSEEDVRDIPVTAVMNYEEELPEVAVVDIEHIPVLNQGRLGICTACSFATMLDYQKGLPDNSTRFLYLMTKYYDKLKYKKDFEGSWLKNVASVIMKHGVATDKDIDESMWMRMEEYLDYTFTKSTMKSASNNRVDGYVHIGSNGEELKQAINNFGVVVGTINKIKWDNRTGRFYSKDGVRSAHALAIYGYEGDKFLVRNSWGKDWGNKGNGYFYLKDTDLKNVMVTTPIKKKIVDEYKKKWPYKYFTPSEVKGLKTELIEKLEKIREELGRPIIISSGFRTQAENKRIGGAKYSKHLSGSAVDIKIVDMQYSYDLVKLAYKYNFGGIEVATSHIHLDIRAVEGRVLFAGISK